MSTSRSWYEETSKDALIKARSFAAAGILTASGQVPAKAADIAARLQTLLRSSRGVLRWRQPVRTAEAPFVTDVELADIWSQLLSEAGVYGGDVPRLSVEPSEVQEPGQGIWTPSGILAICQSLIAPFMLRQGSPQRDDIRAVSFATFQAAKPHSWSWPLRLDIFEDDKNLTNALVGMDAAKRKLVEIVPKGDADILCVADTKPSSLRTALSEPAGIILVQAPRLSAHSASGAIGQALSQDLSALLGFIDLEGANFSSFMDALTFEMSHNKPLDVALFDAFAEETRRNWNGIGKILPPILFSPVFDRANIFAEATVENRVRDVVKRLTGLPGRVEIGEPAAPLRWLGIQSASRTVREYQRDLIKAIDGGSLQFDRESEGSSALGPLAEAIDRLGERITDVSSSTQTPAKQTPSPEDSKNEPVPPRYTDINVYGEDGNLLGKFEPITRGPVYTIDVAIRVQRTGLTKGREDQGPTIIPEQTKTASVWVVATDESDDDEGGHFRFKRRLAELKVPIVGDSVGSARLSFSLVAKARNPDERPRISIRLYHKLNLIDHVDLTFRSAEDGAIVHSNGEGSILVTFKRPNNSAVVEALDPDAAARAINIGISRTKDGAYRFALAVGSGAKGRKPRLWATRKITETVLNSHLGKFRDLLVDTVFNSLDDVELKHKTCQGLLKQLDDLSRELATAIFSFSKRDDFYSLYQALREVLLDGSIVQVSLSEDAQDFVFPWQILPVSPRRNAERRVDPQNFWGYRYVIEVKRCGDGAHRTTDRVADGSIRMSYGRWRFKNEPTHYSRIREIIKNAVVAGNIVEPIIETEEDLLDALNRGGGDIMYLYAHGHAAAPTTPFWTRMRENVHHKIQLLSEKLKSNPLGLSTERIAELREMHEPLLNVTSSKSESALILSRSEVLLSTLLAEVDEERLAHAPVIFLNTCESAQIWNGVEGSFVAFFLDRGARAVIGTESTIPVVLAEHFGSLVLEGLFKGASVGEAVLAGRRTLLEKSRNPLGLCYSVYGASDTRVIGAASS